MPLKESKDSPSQSLQDARNNLVSHLFNAPNVNELFLTSNELEAKCPENGSIDQYELVVRFQPGAYCVEAEAFLLYLHSFREEVLYTETLAEILADDMEMMLRPQFVEVVLSQVPTQGLMLSARAFRGVYQQVPTTIP